MHHSILDLQLLRDIIFSLNKMYNAQQILTLDIRDYYDFIQISSHLSNNNLVIVLTVPIIFEPTYVLYKLCPVPNKNQAILIHTTLSLYSNQ